MPPAAVKAAGQVEVELNEANQAVNSIRRRRQAAEQAERRQQSQRDAPPAIVNAMWLLPVGLSMVYAAACVERAGFGVGSPRTRGAGYAQVAEYSGFADRATGSRAKCCSKQP